MSSNEIIDKSKSIVTGSHELFIGKIEHVNADTQLVGDDGNIDFSKLSFLI